jgi:hypothetical protein
MIRLIWTVSVIAQRYFWRYLPTNILLARLRTRRGLKWGPSAMILGVAYLLGAAYCEFGVSTGWPKCVNLLVILFTWNGLKFLFMGPVSMALFLAARVRGRRHRHSPKDSSSASLTGA